MTLKTKNTERLEDENTIDNASSGNAVIVDPSPEQSNCNRMTVNYRSHLCFDCTYSTKNGNGINPFERNFLKIAKIISQQEKPGCPAIAKISSRKT